MAVKKKSSWRSLMVLCFQDPDNIYSPKKTKKDDGERVITKQKSFLGLSILDISNPSSTTLSEDLSISLAGSDLHVFTQAELRVITQSFSSSNFLGEGGFGPVHKGFIDDKLRPGLKAQPVAVKLLDLDGLQGHREFMTEVMCLGKLKHPNLVKLIGYCCEEAHRLLVYEFMPRGSLESQLFRRCSLPLPWTTRLNIAYEAAKGLQFLHEAEKPIIYRDFKASNILLDSDYTAKLSDFGLAKDGPQGDDTHVSTRVMGTQGYAAPEYIMTGHLTAKSDVYSFGVVLLELLTGRKSVDIARSSRKETLVEWARPMLNDARKLGRIMDPRLEDQYSETGARKAATLAYQCLRYRPKTRPDISTVVSVLQDIKDYKDDIPIGIFTYTVPTKPRREVKETSLQNFDKPRRETKVTSLQNFDKTRREVKDTSLQNFDKTRREVKETSLQNFDKTRREVKETSLQNFDKTRREVKETSLQNFDKTRREVKETSLQNFDKPRNVSTTDNHQKFRSPAHTARNHRITLRNGYNSPMRNEAGGERY